MRRTFAAAAFLIVLAGGVARAESLPSYVADTVGEWLVATDDGKPGCRITLAAERVGERFRASPSSDCSSRLPTVARAASWDYDGGVRLFAADGSTLLEFGEDETTLMKTSFEVPPVHFMVQTKPGVDRAPYGPALIGEWVLRRPGGPTLCPLTLAKGPADDDTTLALKTGKPCDPAVARLKLDTAHVEDFALMLYGQPETSLGFEPAGPQTYNKTDGGKPLELVRAP